MVLLKTLQTIIWTVATLLKFAHAAIETLSPVRLSEGELGSLHVVADPIQLEDLAPLGIRDDLGVPFRACRGWSRPRP